MKKIANGLILFSIILALAATFSHRAFAVGAVGLKGTLAAGTTIVSIYGAGTSFPPYTITVTSSTCINSFSFDGGSIYQTLTGTTANGQTYYFVNNPFTQLKMTSCTAGDKYQIL